MKVTEKKPEVRNFTLEVSEPELQYITWALGEHTGSDVERFLQETGCDEEAAGCSEMYDVLHDALGGE